MASGYTSIIGEKNASFEEFALTCARAFGALIHMRDDSLDAKIVPDVADVSYHEDRIKQAEREIKKLSSMSVAEAKRIFIENTDSRISEYTDVFKEREELRLKYETMLEKIHSWVPPTPDHAGLKSFMIKQIEESIQFDCNGGKTSRECLEYHIESKENFNAKKWIKQQISVLKKDIKYEKEQIKKEVKAANEKNRWVEQLRKSLK